jgi:CheY-like chemotaxis protein
MSTTELSNFDKIAIMDNDPDDLAVYRKVLTRLGFKKVYAVDSGHKIIELRKKNHLQNFILDIHMGDEREEEGLDALEKLKKGHEDVFVGMLSNHSDAYERKAKRLKADAFIPKTHNPKADICNVVSDMFEKDDLIGSALIVKKLINFGLEAFKSGANIRGQSQSPLNGVDQPELDKNYVVYQKFMANPAWARQYRGSYVAIVDEKVVSKGKDKNEVLEDARKNSKGRAIFFTRVEMDDEVIDIPGPFSIEDL